MTYFFNFARLNMFLQKKSNVSPCFLSRQLAFLDEKKRKENKKDRRLPQDLGNGSWFLLGFFLRPRVILS
jgi:hypothetical protein